VYASFGARGLVAVDFNGTIVWQRDLGPMGAYHGIAGSPLLVIPTPVVGHGMVFGLLHE